MGVSPYGVLATLAHESQLGQQRWDYDSGLAALERQHGVEGAAAIIKDARLAASKLPRTAFDWLENSPYANSPTVLTRMALAWRNRRAAAR